MSTGLQVFDERTEERINMLREKIATARMVTKREPFDLSLTLSYNLLESILTNVEGNAVVIHQAKGALSLSFLVDETLKFLEKQTEEFTELLKNRGYLDS